MNGWMDMLHGAAFAVAGVARGALLAQAGIAPEELAAWQQGRTGLPIIDAAMRQLLETGWMHNRLRMIVAMFLTKNLLID